MSNRRRKWSDLERAELVRDYQSSGMKQREFCVSRGISVSGLQKSLNQQREPESKFIELPSASSRTTLEVCFSDGTTVRLG